MTGPEPLAGLSAACPKHMVFGPCGGVTATGGCEVDDRPCPFVAEPTVRWNGGWASPSLGTDPLIDRARHHKLVVADLPTGHIDAASVSRAAAGLAGRVDATLFGDTGWARVQLPPS